MAVEIPARRTSGPRTAWAWTVGTFFGAGLGKPGPGTWGSVAALLLWCATARFSHLSPAGLAIATTLAALAATLIGIPAGTIVARESGREDPGHVVIDEATGQWIALIGLPFAWPNVIAALIFFRVFDITKPPPARQAERLPGGLGIMMDDVVAGLFALACGHILHHWI